MLLPSYIQIMTAIVGSYFSLPWNPVGGSLLQQMSSIRIWQHCHWVMPCHHCRPLIKCINGWSLGFQTATSSAPIAPRGIPVGTFQLAQACYSLTPNNADFGKQENPLTASSPASTQDNSTGIIIKNFLHCLKSDSSILVGLEVISANGLCPAFSACPNSNIFQHHFGIEFCYEGRSCITVISPFKFSCCFSFIDQLTYCLSQAHCKF